jgi:hypothetical protein
LKLGRFEARRYEGGLPEGRTHPLVLGCRPEGSTLPASPKVVKALGCPEVAAGRQLVAEVVGNAVARRMGVLTPEPCIVHISDVVAGSVGMSLETEGFPHRLRAGYAAGCEFLQLAPYAVGQNLNPQQRTQASRLYVFDMLSQNSDRRAGKVNCALGPGGLVAFDFESCFPHLFLPIIGGLGGALWEPSKSVRGRDHLFRPVAIAHPLPPEAVETAVLALSPEWWEELRESLPGEWQPDAGLIGNALRGIWEHAAEFAQDIARSLA